MNGFTLTCTATLHKRLTLGQVSTTSECYTSSKLELYHSAVRKHLNFVLIFKYILKSTAQF